MKLVIFGAEWCTSCKMTKELCEKHKVDFEFKDVSAEPEALDELQKLLGSNPTTIPRIFNEDGLIGGYTQLKELLED